ncbi:MAG TPA: DUF4443 domain-containing protein [Candidatus Altiarchaeales archaeon]|nr:DUF4443 domain-containing protein [Candidatus Altiarchaeales archaeon]
MVGAAPSFSEVHILRTLLILKRKQTGRKNLVKELSIGEGSVRTILKRLDKENLIVSEKLGHRLSRKGNSIVEGYLRKFTMPVRFDSGDVELFSRKTGKSLVIVHNSADRIRFGVEERDTALMAGSEGALIITFMNGKLRLPVSDIKLSDFPETVKKLKEMDLKERDTVIISFGGTYSDAENGALAIAMKLSEI